MANLYVVKALKIEENGSVEHGESPLKSTRLFYAGGEIILVGASILIEMGQPHGLIVD